MPVPHAAVARVGVAVGRVGDMVSVRQKSTADERAAGDAQGKRAR